MPNYEGKRLAEVASLLDKWPQLPRGWMLSYHRLIQEFPGDLHFAGWRVQIHRDNVLVVEVLWNDLESAAVYAAEAAAELFQLEWKEVRV